MDPEGRRLSPWHVDREEEPRGLCYHPRAIPALLVKLDVMLSTRSPWVGARTEEVSHKDVGHPRASPAQAALFLESQSHSGAKAPGLSLLQGRGRVCPAPPCSTSVWQGEIKVLVTP